MNVVIVNVLVTIGVALFTSIVGAVIHLWASAKAAGRIEGAIEQRFQAIEKDVDDLEDVDDQQWQAINSQRRDLTETREDVAEIKGRMSAQTKVNGAASGRT